MHFATFVMVALLTAAPARAFTAWKGTACSGELCFNGPCDGSCADFSSCHSFKVNSTGEGGTQCGTFYSGSDCGGQAVKFTGQGDQCTTINAGTQFKSFRCFSGASCV
ncbi:hypothetical protein AURDEDRAFT_166533 [Auricularia subglabra TFB-10046 SS5]|nr:hypothetical protein AURDEDRAFT_166533 [Auricularia subglabra TFB-10046 SS5]